MTKIIKSFLGTGWGFPPAFSNKTSDVGLLSDVDDIQSSLEILLTTRPGERVMRPDYGCNLDELLFENLDTRMKTLIADKIESAILYHEPRITLENVDLTETDGLEGIVLIEIVYRVKTTNSRFNFVYPYYRLQGTDINLTTTVNLLPESV